MLLKTLNPRKVCRMGEAHAHPSINHSVDGSASLDPSYTGFVVILKM